jgi:hypothetical protein
MSQRDEIRLPWMRLLMRVRGGASYGGFLDRYLRDVAAKFGALAVIE